MAGEILDRIKIKASSYPTDSKQYPFLWRLLMIKCCGEKMEDLLTIISRQKYPLTTYHLDSVKAFSKVLQDLNAKTRVSATSVRPPRLVHLVDYRLIIHDSPFTSTVWEDPIQ